MVFEPDYAVVARFAAVAATLAVLHARGLVVAGRSGSVRRAEVGAWPPAGFEREVWAAIHGFVSPGALMARPKVDAALSDLRRRARRLGLVRPLIPVKGYLPATRVARRLLDAAASDYPWPPTPESEEDGIERRVGLAVALYGAEALNLLMPRFARASGLLDRAATDGLDWADPGAPSGEGRYF